MTYVCKYTPPEAEAVIRRMFAALEAGGWTPYKVFDGEEMEKVTDLDSALEVIDAVEESDVYFRKDRDHHSVFLIPGNGEDVICDYSYAIDDADGFNAIMDSLMEDEA